MTFTHPLSIGDKILSVSGEFGHGADDLEHHTGPYAIGRVTSVSDKCRDQCGWIYGIEFPPTGVQVFLHEVGDLDNPARYRSAPIAPLVHMNGTSRAELCRQYEAAIAAIDQLAAVLRDAAPNGRDYYRPPPGSFVKAMAQHQARFAMVEHLRADYFALLMAVSE